MQQVNSRAWFVDIPDGVAMQPRTPLYTSTM
jgi:hypothetical protein